MAIGLGNCSLPKCPACDGLLHDYTILMIKRNCSSVVVYMVKVGREVKQEIQSIKHKRKHNRETDIELNKIDKCRIPEVNLACICFCRARSAKRCSSSAAPEALISPNT